MANKPIIEVTEYTKSYKSLLVYAVFYALSYVLLTYVLNQLDFIVGGVLLTVAIIAVLNMAVTFLFRKRQHRGLDKAECGRIAVLSVLMITAVSVVMFVLNMNVLITSMNINITWVDIHDSGMHKVMAVVGIVTLIIHYAVIFYSLWYMQRLWKT
ncbi:hypothetical protein IPZ60_12895 [Psychrobacter sp. NG25]|uniref:ABZJ_00895 family protein n=1 Tax=Psychrobacter sp. NG25 TaxID=2782005 RepID=UPI001883F585|nr:ABZJ_00895 family protein [Psychrobacter sp. NG25]MBF0659641.1 hypothetical protein [Psychrobacter sp. NG25]